MAEIDTAPPSLSGSYTALFRRRDFILFFSATSVSTTGTAMIPLALTFGLLGAGYTVSNVGGVFAAETLPAVVLLLFGGVASDRWPRRTVMIGADVLRCASQGLLAILLVLGHPALPMVMALAACVGIGNAFYKPAEDGVIPAAAGAERIREANSLVGIAASLASILGPALAGLLVSLGGASLAIGLDSLSYGVSAMCLLLLRTGRDRAAPAELLLGDLRAGWNEFKRHRWLQVITAQFGLLNLVAFAPFFVLGPALLAGTPNGARMWGLVASASGVGGALGGLLILRIRLHRPLLMVEAAMAMLATPLVLLAVGSQLGWLVVGSALFGGALAVINILFSTAIQESIPGAFLSRVSAFVSLVALGLTPVGYALCGPVAQSIGPRGTLGASAALLLVSVPAILFIRQVRRYSSPHRSDGAQ